MAHLISFSNWEDHSKNISLQVNRFGLPDAEYVVRSFWSCKSWLCDEKAPLFTGTVQPHETVLLAVRWRSVGKGSYIGGNIHISQGLEVEKLRNEKNKIDIWFSQKKRLCGHIDLVLPRKPKKATHNGKSVDWVTVNSAIYRFILWDDPGLLSIHY